MMNSKSCSMRPTKMETEHSASTSLSTFSHLGRPPNRLLARGLLAKRVRTNRLRAPPWSRYQGNATKVQTGCTIGNLANALIVERLRVNLSKVQEQWRTQEV